MKRTPDSLRAWQRRSKEHARQKKREKYFKAQSTRPQPKERRPLKKQSKAQARRLVVYQRVRIEYLALPENRLCRICIVRKEAGENIRVNPATEVHHLAGRHGKLLINTTRFCPSCRSCREWPHDNPRRARELGVLHR